jgi:hypothetical protein
MKFVFHGLLLGPDAWVRIETKIFCGTLMYTIFIYTHGACKTACSHRNGS